MGYRKIRSSLYVADAATITQAASLSSAASVAQRLTASTSVAIGGASIVQVESLGASATISIAGGMVNSSTGYCLTHRALQLGLFVVTQTSSG